MDNETSDAVDDFNGLMAEADQVVATSRFSAEHTKWILSVRFSLDRYFGSMSDLYRTFAALDWQVPSGTVISNTWDLNADMEEAIHRAFCAQMETAKGVLLAGVDRLNQVGLAGSRAAVGLALPAANKKVFITHGGHPPILEKVERIVRTLGFNPIIVEREPSSGKAVDDLVKEQMRDCICSIVLATKDSQNEESSYPRPNVIHEIGLAQEILDDKVIYLKEAGVEFPSNVVPKVWSSFCDENPDPVWEKIVKELRGFGFIP